MKSMRFAGAVLLLLCSSALGSVQEISQDSIGLNLGTGQVLFNNEPVQLDQLDDRIADSYSLAVNVWADAYGGGGVTDLFGPAVHTDPVGSSGYSPELLVELLEIIEGAGLEPEMVRLSMMMRPPAKSSAPIDDVCFISESSIEINGEASALDQLPADISKKDRIAIWSHNHQEPVDYLALLAGLKALPEGVMIDSAICDIRTQVKVEAKLYQLNDDGTERVLSSPMITTKPGNTAVIKVVENRSGIKFSFRTEDDYHQEDLAHCGIRFSVKPRIIGDYLRISGAAVLTRAADRDEVFAESGVPVYSYSCTKFVAPFSVVLPPGQESVTIPLADFDGKKTMCFLKASITDERGQRRNGSPAARKQTP